jgi:hypothetical protein
MAEDAIKHLHGQVLVLDPVKEPHALDIVEEHPDAQLLAELREAGLAEMPVGDMADIVPERDRLDQILVEPETPPDGAGDLGDELDMDDPVRDMVIINEIEDLRLVDIPGVGPGMDDPVRVAGIGCADIFCRPVMTPDCIGTYGGKRGELGLALLCHYPDRRFKPLVRSPQGPFLSHAARQICAKTS